MNGSPPSPPVFLDVRRHFAGGFTAASRRALSIGLIVAFGIHCVACEDKAQQARIKARIKALELAARLQADEGTRLKSHEAARRAAEEAGQAKFEEEVRLHAELEAMRAEARSAAAGTTMDTLQTLEGKRYRDVEIREATAIGISIRHGSGVARIGYEMLPQAMQEQFLYDSDEKQQAMDSEIRMRNENARKFAAAHTLMLADQKERQITSNNARKEDLRASLSAVSARVSQIGSEIYSLQRELYHDLESAGRDRYNRRVGGISRAPIIREKLEAKRRQLASFRQKEAQLRAQVGR